MRVDVVLLQAVRNRRVGVLALPPVTHIAQCPPLVLDEAQQLLCRGHVVVDKCKVDRFCSNKRDKSKTCVYENSFKMQAQHSRHENELYRTALYLQLSLLALALVLALALALVLALVLVLALAPGLQNQNYARLVSWSWCKCMKCKSVEHERLGHLLSGHLQPDELLCVRQNLYHNLK